MSIIFNFLATFIILSFILHLILYIKFKPIQTWLKENKIKCKNSNPLKKYIVYDIITIILIFNANNIYTSSLLKSYRLLVEILAIVGVITGIMFFAKIITNKKSEWYLTAYDNFTCNCEMIICNYGKYSENCLVKNLICKIIKSEKETFLKKIKLKTKTKSDLFNSEESKQIWRENHQKCYEYETVLIDECMKTDPEFSFLFPVYGPLD